MVTRQRSTYGGCHTLMRWMRLGKGSRGAPAGWLQVSSPIFNILEKAGFGAEIEHPITREKSRSVGAAFVDDTNMYVFRSDLDTEEKIKKEADEHVAAWVTELRVIGGCAKSAKSFWWLLRQVRECGEWVWASTKGRKLYFTGDDNVKTSNIEKDTRHTKSEGGDLVNMYDYLLRASKNQT